ncbi:hypothetical protein B0H10DRAFT_711550 [Mycena sp. CBHHK59/15]|nr:hypothetical protein B0H10DRAFT_711550 [Mycena sp. CBHHK59/15]
MGGFWSCCRRNSSQERAPLLPKPRPMQDSPHSGFEKLADIVGAVNCGKMPSQDQIAELLQHALRSEFLRDSGNSVSTSGGALSRRGVALLFEIRELLESVLRIGLEKNYDNKFQDLLYQSARLTKPVKVSSELLVDGAPIGLDLHASRDMSSDADDFLQSLTSLARLTITSSAFRMLVSDILTTTREIVAEAASEIGQVASQVEAAAADVTKAAELSNLTVQGLTQKAGESYAGIQQSVGHAHRNLGTLGDDSAERAKDLVIGRVQDIVIQAHQNPQHQSAIRTILVLFRKYSDKLSSVAESVDEPITIVTQVDVSPPFYEAVVDFKAILERLAGRSLNPLLRTFKTAVVDVLDAPSETGTELNRYFTDLGRWFDRALADPQFAASRLGARTAGELYDVGRLFLASEANFQWARHFRLLVDQAQSFVRALESDAATQQFIQALHTVSSALRGLAQDTVGAQRKWRQELLKDALGWFIPRVLKSVRALPMPRVEFQNSALDVAVDALLLTSASTSASLTPDHIWVQNWSELRVDTTTDSPAETSTRTRVHIDGMRCAAHGFGYFFRYKGPVGYSDEGLLDVDVGSPASASQGLAVDIEIETTQHARDTPGEPLFRLVDVNVQVPGLAFAITHSKHWILNSVVLQPLAGPVVRVVLKAVLEQQIRGAFDRMEKALSVVVEEASRIHDSTERSEEGPSADEYWTAFLSKAPSLFQIQEHDPSVAIETNTTSTLKGIIHTTTTVPEAGGASTVAEETVLAVGGGAQLFPNKGGPYGVDEVTSVDVAREAVNDIQQTIGKTREMVGAVEDESVRVRKDIERAEERKIDRERFERRRGGWRSHAFDLTDLESS